MLFIAIWSVSLKTAIRKINQKHYLPEKLTYIFLFPNWNLKAETKFEVVAPPFALHTINELKSKVLCHLQDLRGHDSSQRSLFVNSVLLWLSLDETMELSSTAFSMICIQNFSKGKHYLACYRREEMKSCLCRGVSIKWMQTTSARIWIWLYETIFCFNSLFLHN